MSKVLVTGGAGFIGSHLVDELVEIGNEVVVVDNLEVQVHTKKPGYLNLKAQYLFEDIRDERIGMETRSQSKGGVEKLVEWVRENKDLF